MLTMSLIGEVDMEASSLQFQNTLAVKTLPNGLSLGHSKLPNTMLGVFTGREIKKDTIFGPYVGTRTFCEHFTYTSDRVWKIFLYNQLHHYIDGQDPQSSNWMRYVNFAGRAGDQNLEAFQFQYKIYYRAIVDIQEDTELLVWYSQDYNHDFPNASDRIENLISQTRFGNDFQELQQTTSNYNASINTAVSGTFENNSANLKVIIRQLIINEAKKIEKSYKCDVCGKLTKNIIGLRRHMVIHSDEKPYDCDVCSAAFRTNTQLKYHRKIHTRAKPYQCDVCSAAFSLKTQLTYHRRNHTGTKPYKCNVCRVAFSSDTKLAYHRSIHTDEKPHKCDVCSSAFATKTMLKGHRRIHTDAKPYKCEVCIASFASKSRLDKHKRFHVTDKPYKCDVCSAAYLAEWKLITHVKVHKGKTPRNSSESNAPFGQKIDLTH